MLRSLAAPTCLLLATGVPAQDPIHTWWGTRLCSSFGRAVASGGDLDGDGVADLLVGAPGCAQVVTTVTGSVIAYSGATGAVLWQVWGTSRADDFGRAIEPIGDVNYDGTTDFAVGTFPIGPLAGTPYVRWISGRDGTAMRAVAAPVQSGQFGASLAAAGDLDGDGVPDVWIGAPQEGTGVVVGAGVVRAYSTASSIVIRELRGTTDFESYGTALESFADVDGDGVRDLLVGAPMPPPNGGTGQVSLESGGSGLRLRTWVGSSPGDLYGIAVSAAGDLDGDGAPDLAIGASSFPQGAELGMAHVLSLATGAELVRIEGGFPGHRLGIGVTGGRDLDGDGVPELLVVTRSAENADEAGAVEVRSGADGRFLYRLYGHDESELFGRSVAWCDDLDGDGAPEIVVGAPGTFSGPDRVGAAHVYSGWQGRPLLEVDGHRVGSAARVRIGAVRAHSPLHFGVSLQGGGPHGTVAGPLFLDAPVRRFSGPRASAGGTASFSVWIPASARGATAWVQCLGLDSGGGWALSNGRELRIR